MLPLSRCIEQYFVAQGLQAERLIELRARIPIQPSRFLRDNSSDWPAQKQEPTGNRPDHN